MALNIILAGFLVATFLMVVTKRITALIRTFRIQSIFLFLYTFYIGLGQCHVELFVICGLVLVLKVVAVPLMLLRITRRINNRDGSFGGLVLATVNPESFTRYYRDLMAGSQSFAFLLGIWDRKLRAQVAVSPGESWSEAAASPLWPCRSAG